MDYLNHLKNNIKRNKIKEQDTSNIQSKIFDFFKENPKPPDDQVHDFAKSLGIKPDDFEAHIYMILGSFLGAGKSKDFKGTYDPKELKMGIKVEMEHTVNEKISEKIARDHLAEIPDYYTRLLKMEKEAGVE